MDLSYSEYVTFRFMRTRPETIDFKEDLEQEAALAQVKAEQTYDPTKGMDKELWLFYKIRNALVNYMVREMKHFSKPQQDHNSQYWEIHEHVEVDEIPPELDVRYEPDHKAEVRDLVHGIEFTENQEAVLKYYLSTGSHKKAAEVLGISQQRVSQIYQDVIKKIKKFNDID